MADKVGRSRGFTLIELSVVMLVLAVAVAVVTPSIGRGLDALRARTEVSGFTTFLRYARQQAVTRREAQEVRVDPHGRVLALFTRGEGKARVTRRIGESLRIEAASPAGLSVRFLPQGVSSGAAFRIEAPGPRVFVVTVDPLTGRVSERRDGA